MPVEGVFHNLVIAKIKKEYAGQGQKVMNAMWGAGQMMFNKILVLTATVNDNYIDITHYEKLAKDVFKNLNPANDIYFSQGPMDVLDHSCSKMGFGGKMCIDGTFKYEEELDENFSSMLPCFTHENASELLKLFPEIKAINFSLIEKEIPVLIISIKKNKKNHVKELHESIMEMKEMEGIKMILYVEHTVDANDLTVSLWRFCNNLDPRRDHFVIKKQSFIDPSKYYACIGFDGTIKTKELDDFYRDWPNIIIADDETIISVDKKWNNLGLGEFISSPSLKFKGQMYGEEAVAASQ
ncbi:MAG TPA: menaquinone biosynthesis decarboxylase, partial [Ginsengibacter sp.]